MPFASHRVDGGITSGVLSCPAPPSLLAFLLCQPTGTKSVFLGRAEWNNAAGGFGPKAWSL